MTDRKVTCVACKGAGGGATYTAGTGIVIESNEISADTSVLATKTELPDMDDYQEKLTAGTGIDITSNEVSVDTDTIALKSDIVPGYELVAPTNYDSLYEYTSTTLTLLKDIIIEKDNCLTHYVKGSTFNGTNALASIFAKFSVENNKSLLVAANFKIRDFFMSASSSVGFYPIQNIQINKQTGSNEGIYQIMFPYENNASTSKSGFKIYARD